MARSPEGWMATTPRCERCRKALWRPDSQSLAAREGQRGQQILARRPPSGELTTGRSKNVAATVCPRWLGRQMRQHSRAKEQHVRLFQALAAARTTLAPARRLSQESSPQDAARTWLRLSFATDGAGDETLNQDSEAAGKEQRWLFFWFCHRPRASPNLRSSAKRGRRSEYSDSQRWDSKFDSDLTNLSVCAPVFPQTFQASQNGSASCSSRASPLRLHQLLCLHCQQSSTRSAARDLSLLHQRPVRLPRVRRGAVTLPPHHPSHLLLQVRAPETALLSARIGAQARRLL